LRLAARPTPKARIRLTMMIKMASATPYVEAAG
jgi:hypothetical protein